MFKSLCWIGLQQSVEIRRCLTLPGAQDAFQQSYCTRQRVNTIRYKFHRNVSEDRKVASVILVKLLKQLFHFR